MQPHTRLESFLNLLTLERGLVIGIVLLLGGFLLSARAVGFWVETGYGPLDPRQVMRTAIPSVSMMLLGMECCLASFFLGVLRMGYVEKTTADDPVHSASAPSKIA